MQCTMTSADTQVSGWQSRSADTLAEARDLGGVAIFGRGEYVRMHNTTPQSAQGRRVGGRD